MEDNIEVDDIHFIPDWTAEEQEHVEASQVEELPLSSLEEDLALPASASPSPSSSLPPSPHIGILDFTTQVNELQEVHEREQRALEEMKKEHLEERKKLTEVTGALEKVNKVRATLEAEVAVNQKEIQDLNDSANLCKQDLIRLIFETSALKKKLGQKTLLFNKESYLLEKEARKVEAFCEDITKYFDDKKQASLAGKRDRIAALRKELSELEEEDKKLSAQSPDRAIEELQQKLLALSMTESLLTEQVAKTQQARLEVERLLEEAKERGHNNRKMAEEDLLATVLRNTQLSLTVSTAEEKVLELNKLVANAERCLAEKREAAVRKRRELFSLSF